MRKMAAAQIEKLNSARPCLAGETSPLEQTIVLCNRGYFGHPLPDLDSSRRRAPGTALFLTPRSARGGWNPCRTLLVTFATSTRSFSYEGEPPRLTGMGPSASQGHSPKQPRKEGAFAVILIFAEVADSKQTYKTADPTQRK